MTYVTKLSVILIALKDTSTIFMKDRRITNVIYVTKLSLNLETSVYTSKMFMKH